MARVKAREADGRAFIYLIVAIGLGLAAWWTYRVLMERQARGEWLLGRDCPFGSTASGQKPPSGTELWCLEKTDEGGFRKTGPYRQWHTGGAVRTKGLYLEGKRQGVWTTFASDGSVVEEGGYVDDRREGSWRLLIDGRAANAHYERGELLRYSGTSSEGRTEIGTMVRPGLMKSLVRGSEGRTEVVGHRNDTFEKVGAWVICEATAPRVEVIDERVPAPSEDEQRSLCAEMSADVGQGQP